MNASTTELADEAPNTTTTRLGELQRRLLDGPDRLTQYRDENLIAMLRETFQNLLAEHDTKLISVDVFDTMLIRAPTSELRRFAEIAALIAQHDGPKDKAAISGLDVLMARLSATRASYRFSEAVDGAREGTLSQIARVSAALLALDDSAPQRFVSRELEYEVSTLTFNSELHALLEDAAQAGARIVYLSDMYLDAGQIRRLLREVGGIDDAEVISSADVKLPKHSGQGFTRLIKSSGLEPPQMIHIGDSLQSDYQQPRLLGIGALHLPIPTCERDEIERDHHEVVASLGALGVDVTRWKESP